MLFALQGARFVSRGEHNFCIGRQLATLLLGALGYAEMWMALVADVGVCLIAILNAMRAMHPGK